ncbi:metallophosphoesterase [Arcobacter nitrofigilis DSM 7299]|uniref:Probable glycerophosphodiester phosphodiesterase GpdQ n=1 Tax=Arcobacter nitrofigilis (strain ATCC 33309 / DSM 7299 / CCUG 15893 / LMG 7604 / NCTC 12251 / CI) TaxID=572480 RepID=GPDQ_ARCNC|nr:phosphodiesterase [Arcobacter nitrofigilis]D5V0N9.1 RecName: Full=Probable glycerophosphodiester phosphodiesterase GpdQ; Short=GDPD; Short=Glycerophosphoryl diester phosphodiesterase; AltName: Full=Glycerophosphodiesterase; AltName: Full=Glycerophosphorylethanolamine phosphodiesterase; Short=GPE phosphodiesterase [Arcobacter nitrofigilis DSM 7299]ADG93851.1 metallophosphoesterase [Arcobacter nitrofigilis DSM 7299]
MIVVQVSDTHIKSKGKLAYNKVDIHKALYNCILHINNLKPKPDLVIFTGDITDNGTNEEYKLFKETVKLLDVPFYVIPGNHDNAENLKREFEEYDWFEENNHLSLVIEDFPIRIIGLDSSIKGKSYGGLSEERLLWLEKQLNKFPDKKVLLFIHHPPVKIGIEHMDVQNLQIGRERLADLLGKYEQVLALACGHVHRVSTTLWNKIIVLTAASPSHQVALDLRKDAKAEFVMEPPSVQLHYWTEEQGLTTHTSYIGKFEGPYPFYNEKGELID